MKEKEIIETALDLLADYIKKNKKNLDEIIELQNYARLENRYLEIMIVKVKQSGEENENKTSNSNK